MLEWDHMRLDAYVTHEVNWAYLLVLRRVVPGTWANTHWGHPHFVGNMKASLMAHLVRAQQQGLSMQHVIDTMNRDQLHLKSFAMEMREKIAQTLFQDAYPEHMIDAFQFHMELIFADIDQKRLHFHIIILAPDTVDILIWLPDDPEHCMPCLLIKLDHMQEIDKKKVEYIINSARIGDGMAALDDIPMLGFINSHHGLNGEKPSHQEPLIDRAARRGECRFHASFRSLRDHAEGISDSEMSADEEGGGGVCGE